MVLVSENCFQSGNQHFRCILSRNDSKFNEDQSTQIVFTRHDCLFVFQLGVVEITEFHMDITK